MREHRPDHETKPHSPVSKKESSNGIVQFFWDGCQRS
jgi:hypothetical protein